MQLPELVTPRQIMEKFGISRTTELRWRAGGFLPNPIRMGRRVYYIAEQIEQIFSKKIS